MKWITSAFSASDGLTVSNFFLFEHVLVFPLPPLPCLHGTMTTLHVQSILSPWICPCIVHASSSLWLCCCAQQFCPHCPACLQPCIQLFCLRLQSSRAMQCLYPKFLAPLALQQSSCSCPATSNQLAPMAVGRSHAWCVRVSVCVGVRARVCVSLCVCVCVCVSVCWQF